MKQEPVKGARPGSNFAGKEQLLVLLVALGAVLTLLVPALFYGPWLPLIDLVSFVGMDSYAPQLSYGPVHYATFQFTYIGHYAISRLLCDLHVSVPYQILLLYLVEAGTCFVVVWRSLERLIANPWWRAVGIALGTLAFWDGIFLWGGPLAYSLAATSLTVAMFLAMREAGEPQRNSPAAIVTLIALSILCHPFAVPFALILCGLRFLFVARQRWHTILLSIGVVVFALVIVRDSPPSEAAASQSLFMLFGVKLEQIHLRLIELFEVDSDFADALFGATPATSAILFRVLTLVHIGGFVLSPYVILRAREAAWLRMLATLNAIVGVLYLFSWDFVGTPIPEWPQRILTLYAPFTYLGGFASLVYAMGNLRPKWLAARTPPAAWVVPAILLLFMAAVQAPVLRRGDDVRTNYTKVRDEILKTGVTGAYVVVAGIDDIQPFFLRCVPFLLFSDPQLIARHVLVATEWHFQDRHPTRLAETAFNLGRPRYLAEFSSTEQKLSVKLVPQTAPRFPIIERTNVNRWGNAAELAIRQSNEGARLLEEGFLAAALEHFNTAIYLEPNLASAWNDGGAALVRAGKGADAVHYFEQAIAHDPTLVAARVNLASQLMSAGRMAEATSQLEEALRQQPEFTLAKALLDKIKSGNATAP